MIMSMRDLIPWGRQTTTSPAVYRGEERSPFFSLRRDIDRLFDDVFSGSMPTLGFGRSMMSWPSVEVSETDREIRITADIPGMSDKDIEVRVEDGVLTLRGEKKSETDDNDRGYSERFYGRFERRIALPSGVDHEAAKADFRNGVLTVSLPKAEEAERGRRIPINEETRH
jgi:HSP20 family protein